MPTQKPSRLWFELNSGSDPIDGQMHADDNPSRPFHSWLELVALIEETRAQRPDPNPHQAVAAVHFDATKTSSDSGGSAAAQHPSSPPTSATSGSPGTNAPTACRSHNTSGLGMDGTEAEDRAPAPPTGVSIGGRLPAQHLARERASTHRR